MFRPNRVGTPIIHQSTANESIADFDIRTRVWTSVVQPYNVINAIPDGDFGRAQLNWTGNENLPALHNMCFAHQFTVATPNDGDTVGIELNGGFTVYCANSAIIRPILFRQEAPLGSVLAPGNSGDSPTPIGEALNGTKGDNTLAIRSLRYQTTLVAKSTSNIQVAGPYAHGIAIIDQSNTVTTINWCNAVCSVRQLNNQQGINYRDTLR